jgi:hypothetical protein
MSYRAGVRPSKTVAGAVLSALLALAAVPGLAVTRDAGRDLDFGAAAFHEPEFRPGSGFDFGPLDAAWRAGSFIDGDARFEEPGETQAVPGKPSVRVPASRSTWGWKEPLYTLTGEATFYDAGYTAMRLPRGTVVVICGKAACIERIVNDYGPIKPSRIVDLYRADFFEVCGCEWWEGVTPVTVRVY